MALVGAPIWGTGHPTKEQMKRRYRTLYKLGVTGGVLIASMRPGGSALRVARARPASGGRVRRRPLLPARLSGTAS